MWPFYGKNSNLRLCSISKTIIDVAVLFVFLIQGKVSRVPIVVHQTWWCNYCTRDALCILHEIFSLASYLRAGMWVFPSVSATALQVPQPVPQKVGTGPSGFDSPEKSVTKYPGRDLSTLCDLAVSLAKDVFGERTLSLSSRSGRNDTNQLDPEKLLYIKDIVRARVGDRRIKEEFELVWKKCLENIGKRRQKLRSKNKLFWLISVICAVLSYFCFVLCWSCFRVVLSSAFVLRWVEVVFVSRWVESRWY